MAETLENLNHEPKSEINDFDNNSKGLAEQLTKAAQSTPTPEEEQMLTTLAVIIKPGGPNLGGSKIIGGGMLDDFITYARGTISTSITTTRRMADVFMDYTKYAACYSITTTLIMSGLYLLYWWESGKITIRVYYFFESLIRYILRKIFRIDFIYYIKYTILAYGLYILAKALIAGFYAYKNNVENKTGVQMSEEDTKSAMKKYFNTLPVIGAFLFSIIESMVQASPTAATFTLRAGSFIVLLMKNFGAQIANFLNDSLNFTHFLLKWISYYIDIIIDQEPVQDFLYNNLKDLLGLTEKRKMTKADILNKAVITGGMAGGQFLKLVHFLAKDICINFGGLFNPKMATVVKTTDERNKTPDELNATFEKEKEENKKNQVDNSDSIPVPGQELTPEQRKILDERFKHTFKESEKRGGNRKKFLRKRTRNKRVSDKSKRYNKNSINKPKLKFGIKVSNKSKRKINNRVIITNKSKRKMLSSFLFY
jgi:hypothetical protein